MNQIYLKWATGEMTIDLDGFFPAKAGNVKKLLEIVNMDIQDEDHIGLLLNHLNNRIHSLGWLKSEYSDRYLAAGQEVADYKCRIDSGTHSNGLPIMPDELKEIKAEYQEAKRHVSRCKKEYDQCIRTEKQLLKNIEQLKKAK